MPGAEGICDSLLLLKGQYCWVLKVDMLVEKCGGGLVDACVMAAHAALRDCSLPAVKVVDGQNGAKELILCDEDSAEASDPFVPLISRGAEKALPLVATLLVLRVPKDLAEKIGAPEIVERDLILADPSEEESKSSLVVGRVSAAVNAAGSVVGLDVKGVLRPDTLRRCIRAAARASQLLFAGVDSALRDEAEERERSSVLGKSARLGFVDGSIADGLNI